MSVFVEQLDLGGSGPTVGIKDSIDVAGFATRAGGQFPETGHDLRQRAWCRRKSGSPARHFASWLLGAR